ncbi:tetratricopeptide repeat protein [Roseomonas fluvialis]|uniref:protein O-GlcNAc transferase n=1 Tax=Roseomonas fluvialis TaxID=1750527 RepID=A0ABN6P8I2_9PROT|nr:tetratricopeptide repeat protein [Roseomonas fluvialis]BDG75234.1 O-linked acetylglucosamine transferase [Roseomonas fluvialis]
MAPLDTTGEPLEILLPRIEGAAPAAAIAAYNAWLAENPSSPQRFAAWFNLGVVLAQSGDRAAAMIAYRQALSLKPDLHQAQVNLGLALEAEGRADEALALWSGALQPNEARLPLLNHQGRLLETRKDYAGAERALRASLLIDPRQPDVVQHWSHLRQKGCMWPLDGGGIPGLTPDALALLGGPLGALALTDDPALQRRIATAWIDRKVPAAPERLAPVQGYRHARIRVGYLSSDFCRHAMGFLIAGLLERHDRSRFDIYGYCSTDEDRSDLRRRIVSAFDHHVPIGHLSDEAAARRIRADEIDVLVDLNGLTRGARLAALRWKPAPVQATYLGYVGPVPIPELDWMICDSVVVPADQADHYAPRPLPLDGLYQANDDSAPPPAPASRTDEGLPDDAFVLACFNNFYKITPDVFAAWMRILHGLPKALLWMTDDNATGIANLRAAAQAAGIAPDRILFASRCDPQRYLARLGCADVFLDTFPYNAGTVASDALRMGLPIVTLAGRSFASRMAASLLTAAGLTEGVATTLDDYVAAALRYGRDPAALSAARAALSGGAWLRSGGNAEAFTRRMEAALSAIRL